MLVSKPKSIQLSAGFVTVWHIRVLNQWCWSGQWHTTRPTNALLWTEYLFVRASNRFHDPQCNRAVHGCLSPPHTNTHTHTLCSGWCVPAGFYLFGCVVYYSWWFSIGTARAEYCWFISHGPRELPHWPLNRRWMTCGKTGFACWFNWQLAGQFGIQWIFLGNNALY